MLKYACIFEYTLIPLGFSLRIFETWELAVHYLNYNLSPKILFEQEFIFDICDIEALIQCNIELCNILGYIRIVLMAMKQDLTNLMGTVYRFELQKKIRA